MMHPVHRINASNADAVNGRVELDTAKMCWNIGMIVAALVFAPITFSVSAFILFLVSTYFSLLIGHSAGMHRMMIHRAYEVRPVVERALIYVGTLVGMSGPYGIIKIHDARDWAQRQNECHNFFSHTEPLTKDVWWQLTSRFVFDNPPVVTIEPKFANSRFYRWLERTWRLHQVGLAVLLYFWGGWSFVVWGVFVRVSVSVVGHWMITHFCHKPGRGSWHVAGASVQVSNIPGLGLLTYGECWHNNHHAFPESAQIGLEPGQSDPAFAFIRMLEKLGLACNVGQPRSANQREDLQRRDSDWFDCELDNWHA